MTVFFGIPVKLDEAMRIFGLPCNVDECNNLDKNIILRLRGHLEQCGVYFFQLYNGQFIFGYVIGGLDVCAGRDRESFVPYYQMMTKLHELAKQFHTAMRLLKADLREVFVYSDSEEGIGYSVKNPEPMVFEGDY